MNARLSSSVSKRGIELLSDPFGIESRTASVRMGKDSSVHFRTAEMSNSEQSGVSGIAGRITISV